MTTKPPNDMKISGIRKQEGSVLLTTFLSITILTMICATSLYIASQNATGGAQAASWQQSLTAAETGVDEAIRALNTGSWTNWRQATYTGTLPSAEPSPFPTATASIGPDSSHYNVLPSTASLMTMTGEGAVTTSAWVTVDTAGMTTGNDSNNKQWYRIRSTGQAAITGPMRASMNKLDNDLRNTLALKFNRKNSNSTTMGPTRTIEVVMQPIVASGWARGITLKDWVSMSGSGTVDSFDSSNSSKSSTISGVAGQYDVTKRQSHGDIGTTNSASADLRSTYVYGSLAYSGTTAVKNTTNVQGTISTPFTPTITTVSAPVGGTWTATASGNPGTLVAGKKNSPTYYKVTGDVTVSGGSVLSINDDGSGSSGQQIYIWVTGKLTTSGSGKIDQASGVQVTWYVGGDITVSGDSYNNRSGVASAMTINGYGTNNKFTDSGSANFIGTVNAPGYDATISGSGSYMGALIADTLTISGGASFHYDEALSTGASSAVGNYAFASWFEDNSDPPRSITY
jgi:hypothetical protein